MLKMKFDRFMYCKRTKVPKTIYMYMYIAKKILSLFFPGHIIELMFHVIFT